MGNTCRDLLVMLMCWLWLVNGMQRGGGVQPPRPKRRGRWLARRSRAGRGPIALGLCPSAPRVGLDLCLGAIFTAFRLGRPRTFSGIRHGGSGGPALPEKRGPHTTSGYSGGGQGRNFLAPEGVGGLSLSFGRGNLSNPSGPSATSTHHVQKVFRPILE